MRGPARGRLWTGETGAALAIGPGSAELEDDEANGFEKGSESRVESDEHPPRSAAAIPTTVMLTTLREETHTLNLLIGQPSSSPSATPGI
jgi:hypothetical protein